MTNQDRPNWFKWCKEMFVPRKAHVCRRPILNLQIPSSNTTGSPKSLVVCVTFIRLHTQSRLGDHFLSETSSITGTHRSVMPSSPQVSRATNLSLSSRLSEPISTSCGARKCVTCEEDRRAPCSESAYAPTLCKTFAVTIERPSLASLAQTYSWANLFRLTWWKRILPRGCRRGNTKCHGLRRMTNFYHRSPWW